MVHHGSEHRDAHTPPESAGLHTVLVRAWLRRAYADADAVMAACNPWVDTGRHAAIPLRLGLDPELCPRPGVPRGDHVLYVGPLTRTKGLFTLLDAAACSAAPWPLRLVGAGPAGRAVCARASRL